MNISEKLKNSIKTALTNLGIEGVSFTIEHPTELSHGDYATNIALICAKTIGKNPRETAELIVAEVKKQEIPEITGIEIAGPGFINFKLASEFFTNSIQEILDATDDYGKNSELSGKKIMMEYTQPNPFKPFHIGHLMSNAIGESLSRVIEFSGANLIRANYQGDVGRHVAIAIYGLQQRGKPDASLPISAQAQYIGECYSWGSNEFETNSDVKPIVEAINKAVYERTDVAINELYDWGRELTLDAFEEIYKTLGTKFDYYFFESDMALIGREAVAEGLEKNIFEKSEGAIVFAGEKFDPSLHTRVFITSQGLPTYDTKEIGLALTKFAKEPDLYKSITTTAVEQKGVIGVAYEAIYQLRPELRGKLDHVMHGMMRLSTGKMSSRKGNIITGESLINDAREMAIEKMDGSIDQYAEELATNIGVAALKYSILRSSPGSDIVFDFDKALTFEGDSGPYLQYTHARICSMIEKATDANIEPKLISGQVVTDLEKYLYRFPEIVSQSLESYAPNYIATYLIETARLFNSFYGEFKIIDTDNVEVSSHRLAIARATQIVLKNGLWLLGITAPERM
jgi:arginyl-tRNA synthetase